LATRAACRPPHRPRKSSTLDPGRRAKRNIPLTAYVSVVIGGPGTTTVSSVRRKSWQSRSTAPERSDAQRQASMDRPPVLVELLVGQVWPLGNERVQLDHPGRRPNSRLVLSGPSHSVRGPGRRRCAVGRRPASRRGRGPGPQRDPGSGSPPRRQPATPPRAPLAARRLRSPRPFPRMGQPALVAARPRWSRRWVGHAVASSATSAATMCFSSSPRWRGTNPPSASNISSRRSRKVSAVKLASAIPRVTVSSTAET
jgi:hypothetical protein